MKTITIVGVGMRPGTLTQDGLAAIQAAEVLLGAPRLTGMFPGFSGLVFPVYQPDAIKSIVAEQAAERFVVLVSGDAGFFSAAAGVSAALSAYSVCRIPGISSFSYFFARLGRSYEQAALVSLHGTGDTLVDTVRRNRLTFCLTGGNLAAIADGLMQAGYDDLTVSAGENLGADGERIVSLPVRELAGANFGSLTVLLVENPDADSRVLTGLPDESFLRGDVPMTKSCVRAVVMSRLALSPDAVCWDIGAGTGSVTVEMALSAYRGSIYAIERNEEGIDLIRKNCSLHHVGNVISVFGSAPDALLDLPAPDAVFIGGSGGSLSKIVSLILQKNAACRIVVTAIALESVQDAMTAFAEAGLIPEIVQLNVSQARPAGRLHLMMAQNPITVLSAGGQHA